MSIQRHECVVIVCDGCQKSYIGYEDEYTVHFDSVEAFIEEQKDYEGEHNQWRIEGDQHFCVDCACERDGHPRDESVLTLSDGRKIQWCRCGRSWPAEATS